MAYGWIGEGAAAALPDPVEQAERAPSLVISTAHSALGAVRRRQVRVGAVTVLLAPDAPGWVREAVVDEIDLGAHLAADSTWPAGTARTTTRTAAGPARCRSPATRPSGPPTRTTPAPSPARPAARPSWSARWPARSRSVGSRWCAGTARPGRSGPTTVVTDELAWVDGGADGLWTVRPGGPDDVAIDRGTPAEVAAALAGMVRAAEGC